MPGIQVKVVKDAPFSAQAVMESTKVLADGNHIREKTTAAISRDAEGRTRREQTLPSGSSVVFIQDPIAGFAYEMNSTKKSARRVPISFADIKPPNAVVGNAELIGSQVMDGIQAEGTRVTHVIAAGDAGNDHPLEVVIEAWYSNELQTTIMQKTSDPRAGQKTFKLTNIQRSEPDESLFKVPSDYTVLDWAAEVSGKLVVR